MINIFTKTRKIIIFNFHYFCTYFIQDFCDESFYKLIADIFKIKRSF